MIDYQYGFLDAELNFHPFREASEELKKHGQFHSWFSWQPGDEDFSSFTQIIINLPAQLKLVNQGDLWSYALLRFLQENGKKVEFLKPKSDNLDELVTLLKEHEGSTLLLPGKLPEIKDLNWQFTDRSGRSMIASREACWNVTDVIGNAHVFSLSEVHPSFIPSVALYLLPVVLSWLDPHKNQKLMRFLGLKSVNESILHRMLFPSDFLEIETDYHKLPSRGHTYFNKCHRSGTMYTQVQVLLLNQEGV